MLPDGTLSGANIKGEPRRQGLSSPAPVAGVELLVKLRFYI